MCTWFMKYIFLIWFFSLSIYQSVSWSMCWGAGAKLSLKKIGLWFWIHEKKNIPPNLRSMIYLQELTQLVRRKSKLEFNKKPLEEGGGNGCFLVGVRIFPTPLLKNKGCWAVVPFALALHHQRHHVSLSLEHLWHGGNAGASWF